MEWSQLIGSSGFVTWYHVINSSGLFLDILGVLILFKTALPNKAIRETAVYELFDIEKAKKYDRISFIAVSLLMIGFGLQILSNFVRPG